MKSTAVANSNIAFVKYWGKKDELLNLPMNPSISMTLDETVSTKTTVEFSDKYSEDKLIIDGEVQYKDKLARVSDFLDIIRKMAGTSLKAVVISKNTFPMGCGIASSASGFAALAAASTKALGIEVPAKELSGLARRGSGSASRSIFGGFAIWEGEYCVQLKNEMHWPELRDVIVIVSDKEKGVSSREGMRLTVNTSQLYKKRIEGLSMSLFKVKRAIINKEFPMLMEAIMQESDSLQACMEDTVPRLEYLNEKSMKLKNIVKNLNSRMVIAGYTFDAGPSAHIITLDKHVEKIINEVSIISKDNIVARPGNGIRYTGEHLIK